MTTKAARRERIEDALGAGGTDTTRLPWRDGNEALPVVQLPLDSIVLNPRSHRIRAHLESSEYAELIAADPFSDEAQDQIARILVSLEGFEDLRENLRATAQRDPGVVTREGLLINANRRAVALREIGRDFITVAVLPSDASNAEIDQLELRLQMQREFREEYTFTNELLFVNDLATLHNHSPERIARELDWAVSNDDREIKKGVEEVQRHIRILQNIREVQRISAGKIKLTFFDDKKQSLIELDDELRNLGDDEAARLRVFDMRMTGMLVGQGYKPLRQMDSDFVDEFLFDILQDDDVFGPFADVLTTSPSPDNETPSGVEVLEGLDSPDLGARNPRPLLEFVVELIRPGIRGCS